MTTSKARSKRRIPTNNPAHGSALIGLVVAILVFSVLAVAIVPMIGSSSRQAAMAELATKAYLMAESGFRYAASEFLHAGHQDNDRNDVLENLDGNYTLNNNAGRFRLSVFSFFYEIVNVEGSSPITIQAHSPGTFPAGEITVTDGLRVRMAGQTYTLATGSQAEANHDDIVTMNIDIPFSTFPPSTMIYPVAIANSTPVSSIGDDDTFDIVCESGTAQMFPIRNGRIDVNGNYYTYRFRNGDRLIDIRDPDAPNAFLASAPDLPTSNDIILTPHVRLVSTGIYGSGNAEVRRTVVYHTPLNLGESGTRQVAFTDTFENKNDWQDVSGNLTEIETIDSDHALRVVDTTEATTGNDEGSLTAFNPTTHEAQVIDFNASRNGTGGFLSYDTQLKIGYTETSNDPPLGYFPASPIPSYVAAGLAFRLGELPLDNPDIFNVNTYGISFMRGNDDEPDLIPDELVPLRDKRIIVLWQQTEGGDNRTWLAYKETADFFFDENFENDPISNQFRQFQGTRWDPETGGRQRNGSTVNWYYGNENTHVYDFGDSDFGVIQSDAVVLPAGIPATLSFWSWHETEFQRPTTHDLKQVFIRQDLGGGLLGSRQTIRTIDDRGSAPGDWYQERVDLPQEFAGQTIRIEFGFNTVDDQNNNFEGWYIDDVRVFYAWPVEEATLSVRLQEAMVVPFDNGSSEIRQGDRVFGHTFLTTGTVIEPPMLTDGNWTIASPARGTLLLNRVAAVATPPFADNEQLLAIDGPGRAVINGYNEATDRQANVIRSYYASDTGTGIGTGNNNPLDPFTEPYGRLGIDPNLTELQWPPDLDADGNWTDDDGDWTAQEDYFRLLQWDVVNPAIGNELIDISFISKDQGLITNAVIQNSHADLVSPLVFGPGTGNPELGLHTFGDGALNVFFDDFGIRLDISVVDTLPSPVQQ